MSSFRTLAFAGDLYDKVRSGEKEITIRANHRDYAVGELLWAYQTEFGSTQGKVIKVTEATQTSLDKVTDEVAREDGFEDRHDLFRALHRFYPDLGWQDPVTVIRFKRYEEV